MEQEAPLVLGDFVADRGMQEERDQSDAVANLDGGQSDLAHLPIGVQILGKGGFELEVIS